MNRMNRWKWLACGAIACGTLLAWGQAAASGRLAGKVVRLGAIVPSSGPFAEWGRTNTVALKMIENQINAAGGVDGAKLKIYIYDDAARPAQAANLVRRLAQDDKVLAIAGPLTSSSCEVAFPVANQMKVVTMSQASSKPGVAAKNRPWAFRDTVDEGLMARATVPYFKKTYHVHTVASIYDAKDAVSTAIATKIMPAVFKANGIKLLDAKKPLTFSTGDIDVSAQVTTLRSLNPDGIMLSADYSQAITVMRELQRQGIHKPILGGSPLISGAILKAAPSIPIVAPGTFFYHASGGTSRMDKFAAQLLPLLQKTPGLASGITPSMFDANIDEIIGLYVNAVKHGGVTLNPSHLASDRAKIRNFVAHGTFQGFAGKVSFLKTGDAIKTYFVAVGQHGEWKPVVRDCSGPGGKGCE